MGMFLLVLAGALQPPIADKQPKVLEAHGDIRSDPYYW